MVDATHPSSIGELNVKYEKLRPAIKQSGVPTPRKSAALITSGSDPIRPEEMRSLTVTGAAWSQVRWSSP